MTATKKVSRDDFMKALAVTAPGLSAGRETVIQGASYAFKDGYVHTFNDETYCRYPFDVPFNGAFPSKGLLEATGKFTADDITITVLPDEVQLTSGRRRAGLRVEDVVMQLDAIELVDDWKPAGPAFGSSLVRAATCVGKDDQKFYRACIRIGDGFVEACDNHHMIRCFTDTPTPTDGQQFLIRGEAAKGLDGVSVVEYGCNASWLGLRTDDGLEYYIRRYVDEYPSLDQFFAGDGSEGQAFRSPEGLAAAIDGANVFARESEEGNITVRMSPGQTVIRGDGATGWFEEWLVTSFDGEPVCFMTNPKIFKQFVERHNVGSLHDGFLRVGTSDDFIYLTSLQMV